MASEAQPPVVILYEHPLLGEGIAKYLRAQIGVEATLGSVSDLQAVRSALALNPAVVIFESSSPFQFDLATLVPNAVLIDVSAVIKRGSVLTPGVAGLEQILQAVRDSKSTIVIPAKPSAVGPGSAEPRATSPGSAEPAAGPGSAEPRATRPRHAQTLLT